LSERRAAAGCAFDAIGAAASWLEAFGVVAPPEFLQHAVKVRDGKDETPLVVIVEQQRGDLAHAHDVAKMGLHLGIGLGSFRVDGIDLCRLPFRLGSFRLARFSIVRNEYCGDGEAVAP
jgi:hypothetical protein